MAIAYQPLESKSGFKSPGFRVDPEGNVTVNSITVAAGQPGEDGRPPESILTVDNIIIRGTQLVQGGEDSSYIAFGDEITGSNLQRLGILQFLDVIGDVRLVNGQSSLNIENGSINISSANKGTIENFDIGITSPGNANFVSVEVGPNPAGNELIVNGAAVLDTIDTDEVTIANLPTNIDHATRKDYVDSRITAFAIAFGA